jgi:hypothetical protein
MQVFLVVDSSTGDLHASRAPTRHTIQDVTSHPNPHNQPFKQALARQLTEAMARRTPGAGDPGAPDAASAAETAHEPSALPGRISPSSLTRLSLTADRSPSGRLSLARYSWPGP